MRYTVTTFAALAIAGLFFMPPQVSGQNSKEYKELQREFYETNAKLDDMRKAQDDRIGALESMLKQMTDANAKLVDQVRALQDKLTDNAAQQEKRVFTPLDQIKKSQDDLWQEFKTTEGAQDVMKARLDNIDKSLATLTGLLGQMHDDMGKASAPPPPSVSAVPTPTTDPITTAYQSAEKDYLAGRLDVALRELMDLATAYPTAPEAPMAIFKTGVIYADYPQPADAIKAFDRVLEQFGDNPYRKPAQFKKAEQLAAMGRNTEAAREFNNYAKLYPDDANAAVAKERAADLTSGPAPAKAKSSSKSKGKR